MIIIATVRLMAGGAALLEGGLVMHGFLANIRNVAVAAQANVHRICFGKPRLPAGVRAVAIGAIARRSRMLYFGSVDQLGFVVVAGHAQRFGIGLRQHDLSVLCRSMAYVALFVGERRMQELGHQLGSGRLVGIVAGQAIGFVEGLILVRFLQVCSFGVVAVQAESRCCLGQMEIKFGLAEFPRFVRGMAGVAAHVEGGVPAAFFRNVFAGLVTAQAKVFFSVPRRGL